jgi:2,4-diketo-3-deoxy-L-fuconate hydrolase
MKICRFDADRVGVVRDGMVHDVTEVTATLPPLRWPVPRGDQFIANFAKLRPELEKAAGRARGIPLAQVKLLSPIANPTKIIGAPINYNDHIAEAKADQTIAHGRDLKSIGEMGMLLKATTIAGRPLRGSCAAVRRPPQRSRSRARGGHRQAMDEHSEGPGLRLHRRICDRTRHDGPRPRASLLPQVDRLLFRAGSVLGPWMVTADEIPDPGNLKLQLAVNGEMRQNSNTRRAISCSTCRGSSSSRPASTCSIPAT